MTETPGKLFVIGEYAVLFGGDAVLVPTPQMAKVKIDEDGRNELTVLHTETRTTRLSEAIIKEPLLAAVVKTLGEADQWSTSSVTLDTTDFFLNGKKLGLGSSAALTAALIIALRPELDLAEQMKLAIEGHRLFQSGRSSGADVALSILGVPIRFKIDREPIPQELPEDLHMLAIWSGEVASTSNFLLEVEKWQRRDPQSFNTHMTKLATCSSDFCATSDSYTMLSLIHRYNKYLHDFSIESGINFYNDAHVAIQKEVESARCVYKPSGAGGGDFGIAFSSDKKDITKLARKLARAGRVAFLLR